LGCDARVSVLNIGDNARREVKLQNAAVKIFSLYADHVAEEGKRRK